MHVHNKAYAGVIGVTPDVGLYTACIGQCLYPLFGTSRHVTFGCSSTSTVLTLAVMATYPASPQTPEYITAVKTLAFMTGIFYAAMAIFRLGFIASFFAYPVLLGFTGGAALQVAASQIRYTFALSGHGSTWIDNVSLLKHMGNGNWSAFGFCLATLVILLAFKWVPVLCPQWKPMQYARNLPITLLLVMFFTLVNYGGQFLVHAENGTWNEGTVLAPEIVGRVDLKFPSNIDMDFSLVSHHPRFFLVGALTIAVV
ncbi:sulfate permease, partial [Reticulomyxa filosa]